MKSIKLFLIVAFALGCCNLFSQAPCDSIEVPYSEEFLYTEPSVLPECWTRAVGWSASNTYPRVISNDGHSGAGCMEFYMSIATTKYINMAATPAFKESLNLKQVSFYANYDNSEYDAYGKLVVGVMSSPTDTSTFLPIQDCTPQTRRTWTNFVIYLTDLPDSLRYIAFRTENTSNDSRFVRFLIDDLEVKDMPQCIRPTELNILEHTLTHNSVDLAWNAGGSESRWIAEYKADGDTIWQTTVAQTNSVALISLLPSTNYTARVKADCQDNGESAYSDEVRFSTFCQPLEMPFSEEFTDFSFNSLDCWEKANVMADDIFNGASLKEVANKGNWKIEDSNIGLQGKKAVCNIYGYNTVAWLITPPIHINTSLSKLEFDAAYTKYANNAPATMEPDDKFMVLFSEDYGKTWTEANSILWAMDTLGNRNLNEILHTPTHIEIDLAKYAGKNIRIAFYGESTAKSNNADNNLYIDNILVSEPEIVSPTVETLPADSIGQTYARLNKHTEEGTFPITEEGFYYRAVGETRWNMSNDGLIQSLTPNTEYEFTAYAIVDNIQYFGDTITFKTLAITSIANTKKETIIYPNPTTDFINIFVNSDEITATLKLISIKGEIVQEKTIYTNKTNQIDISHIPQGKYIVIVQNDGLIIKQEVLIVK